MAPETELLYSEDGVDLTLVRWMLSLTPDQRLQVLQDFVNALIEIREENGLSGYPDDLRAS